MRVTHVSIGAVWCYLQRIMCPSCTAGYRQFWANREEKLICAQCLTFHHVGMQSWKKTQGEETHSNPCSYIQSHFPNKSVTHIRILTHSLTQMHADTLTHEHIYSLSYIFASTCWHVWTCSRFLHMNTLVHSHTKRLLHSGSLTHEHAHMHVC